MKGHQDIAGIDRFGMRFPEGDCADNEKGAPRDAFAMEPVYGAMLGGSATPGADGAAVHVDEIGFGVATDAACATRRSGSGHLADRPRAQPQVGGLTLEVKRVLRHAGGPGPQHRVGLGAAIPGQEHIGLAHIQKVMGGRHDVDGAQVDLLDVICSPVAHEVVHFLDGVSDIFAFDPVDHVQPFARAARIHPNSANVAASAQKPCRVGEGWCRCDHCCSECTEKVPPRYSASAYVSHVY